MPSRRASASISSCLRAKAKWLSVMVSVKCLAILYLPDDGADPEADLGVAAQRLGGAVHGVVDCRQLALGGGEQILALEPPGAGEIGVAADDEALARIVVGGDAGEVALVEQRELEGAGVEQGADLRGAQRSDPVEPGRL